MKDFTAIIKGRKTEAQGKGRSRDQLIPECLQQLGLDRKQGQELNQTSCWSHHLCVLVSALATSCRQKKGSGNEARAHHCRTLVSSLLSYTSISNTIASTVKVTKSYSLCSCRCPTKGAI